MVISWKAIIGSCGIHSCSTHRFTSQDGESPPGSRKQLLHISSFWNFNLSSRLCLRVGDLFPFAIIFFPSSSSSSSSSPPLLLLPHHSSPLLSTRHESSLGITKPLLPDNNHLTTTSSPHLLSSQSVREIGTSSLYLFALPTWFLRHHQSQINIRSQL